MNRTMTTVTDKEMRDTTITKELENQLALVARTIRGLSMDAVQAANSGHPGLPLGCAELGAALFGHVLRYNPKDTQWINRDRFVLSAGHGSMLLYACLYLAGFDYNIHDIKNFRQLHSKTAGHPEYGEPGVETTTGPLGQGIASAVGMALSQKMLESNLGAVHSDVVDKSLLDSQVYVLAGDGCLMEGVSQEASSFAGHLKLNNLIVIYDSNDICLDGPITECFTEDVGARYEAYGWKVFEVDGHNIAETVTVLEQARAVSDQPVLVIAKTTIGKGSPNVAGTSDAHGKPLGLDEIALTKDALGIPKEPLFDVPEAVKTFFKERQHALKASYDDWTTQFKVLSANTEFSTIVSSFKSQEVSKSVLEGISDLEIKQNTATRQSSSAVIQYLHDNLPNLIGGSADLSCSDNTLMKQSGIITSSDFSARNIKYGVREFAMAAIATGISLQGHFIPYCGTFLTFSDYMRNAVRLSALMNVNVIYQFTHDSVFLGEDGPTHQPVEHLASLRAMPGLTVIRPADSTEVKGAWINALEQDGPVALILSRLAIEDMSVTSVDGVKKGAYIIKQTEQDSESRINYCLLATGSEVAMALEVATQLESKGFSVRVVSFPSFELFDEQNKDYHTQVLGGSVDQFWAIEAQSSFGWHKYIGRDGHTITMDGFGLSAPANELKEYYGFTVDKVLKQMETIGMPHDSHKRTV